MSGDAPTRLRALRSTRPAVPRGPAAVPREGEQGDEGQGGADAVRSALNRARAAARERGAMPGARPVGPAAAPAGRRLALGCAPRRPRPPDPGHYPVPAGRRAGVAGVGGRRWRRRALGGGRRQRDRGALPPETFEQGVLVVRADSTAWATQVRLLTATLLRKMADEVGEGTMTKVVVRGPSQPSWRRGPRVAPGGQGPRDTYG